MSVVRPSQETVRILTGRKAPNPTWLQYSVGRWNGDALAVDTGGFAKLGSTCKTGFTGRKISVDTYGGWSVHGRSAVSGKDATKVDRLAAYMARSVMKNIVAAGWGKRVVQVKGQSVFQNWSARDIFRG